MADPSTALPLYEKIIPGLQAVTYTNYLYIASWAIAYYDWLLVLNYEIKLVWKREGVKMKILYSLTRYLPIIYLPILIPYRFNNSLTDAQCTNLYRGIGTTFTIHSLCAALVITIRTWAVWGKAKYMTYIAFGSYTVASTFIFIFYAISLKHTSHPKIEILEGLPTGCIPKYDSPYLPAAIVIEAFYDTATTVLMLIRGASLYRWGKHSRLFQTLYRDGIMFYVYITAICFANAVLLFSKGNYSVLLLTMQGALRSVLACRIILHIRMQFDEMRSNTLSSGTYEDYFAGVILYI
ncbi:hypothetical protein Agabi119p4_5231 [Agaricus bisporus var. burnettii]|uniref:DUF6533 domain-containing protein n=1 Tax=Agaricus bisporus var. burnettii TaxID=192524 RepID=A0A8H7KI58_AGABI|nr:hypothetical protein Agabi119p4_5231 [Agaricus bisporus var. burnettii]